MTARRSLALALPALLVASLAAAQEAAPSAGAAARLPAPTGVWRQQGHKLVEQDTIGVVWTESVTFASPTTLIIETRDSYAILGDEESYWPGCPGKGANATMTTTYTYRVLYLPEGNSVRLQLYPVGDVTVSNIDPPCLALPPLTGTNFVLHWDGRSLSDENGPFERQR